MSRLLNLLVLYFYLIFIVPNLNGVSLVSALVAVPTYRMSTLCSMM